MIVAIPVGPFEWLDEAVDTIRHFKSKIERGDELLLLLDRYTSLPPGFLSWAVRQVDKVIVSRYPFGIGDVRNTAMEYALSKGECLLFSDAHVSINGDVHKLCDVKMGVPWKTWRKFMGVSYQHGYFTFVGPAYNPIEWLVIDDLTEFFVHDNPVYSVAPEMTEVIKEYLPYFPPFYFREISAVLLSIYRLTKVPIIAMNGVSVVHRHRTLDEFSARSAFECRGHPICDSTNPYNAAMSVNLAMYRVLHYGDEHEVPAKDKLIELRRQFNDDLKEIYQRYSRYPK